MEDLKLGHTSVVNIDNRLVTIAHISYYNFEGMAHQAIPSEIAIKQFVPSIVFKNDYFLDFFNIYYSVIYESFLDVTNVYFRKDGLYPVVWGDKSNNEFYSFQDYLLRLLLMKSFNLFKRSFKGKNKKMLEAVNGMDSKTCFGFNYFHNNAISVITTGKSKDEIDEIRKAISTAIPDINIAEIARKLLDNLIVYKENNFSHIDHFSSQEKEDKVKNNVRELFYLLMDNKEILIPYIDGSGLEKYLPNNSYLREDLDRILNKVLDWVILFKKANKWIKNLIWDNVLLNRRIKMYTSRNGDFLEVKGIDKNSLINQKTKLIFPAENDENIFSSSDNLLNPKFQNLTIFDHNTKAKEIISKPSELYLDVEDLRKVIKVATPKPQGQRGQEKNFIEYLQQQINDHPSKKPFQKSVKNGDSYEKIAHNNYQIPKGRRFNYCWTEATKNLPKDSCWTKSGRPKKDT